MTMYRVTVDVNTTLQVDVVAESVQQAEEKITEIVNADECIDYGIVKLFDAECIHTDEIDSADAIGALNINPKTGDVWIK